MARMSYSSSLWNNVIMPCIVNPIMRKTHTPSRMDTIHICPLIVAISDTNTPRKKDEPQNSAIASLSFLFIIVSSFQTFNLYLSIMDYKYLVIF